MMQKKWFKVFIYFMASAFFFAASGILIAVYSASPSQQQSMAYMSGMMKAMESSFMGLSMSLEGDTGLQQVIYSTTSVAAVLIIAAVVAGDFVRTSRRKKNGQ